MSQLPKEANDRFVGLLNSCDEYVTECETRMRRVWSQLAEPFPDYDDRSRTLLALSCEELFQGVLLASVNAHNVLSIGVDALLQRAIPEYRGRLGRQRAGEQAAE